MIEKQSKLRYSAHKHGIGPRRRRTVLFLLVAILALLLSACGGEESSEVSELAAKLTQEASGDAQSGISANAGESEQADPAAAETPAVAEGEAPAAEEEAATPEPPPPTAADDPLASAGATATARIMELEATSAAVAAENAAADAATAEALRPILEEVASYGVDPANGRLAWEHPPLTLEVTDFEDAAQKNQFILTPARDFVLVADITWNSRFAESGCGYIVRSDGEEENSSQYFVGLTRGAEGHVLFGEMVQGDVELEQVTDIYANGIDPLFEWQNDTTNRLAIIGQGQEFTLYSNGTRLGKIVAESGFEEGFVSFVAVNRSGGIKCDFNNAWLWKMN
ncbi:MAG: hypothetical protein R3293_17735 [Candidatus Promineifilaceae bacterium]|nr:hypothetical protein [Candidatus Promineifilaceae bacterium]